MNTPLRPPQGGISCWLFLIVPLRGLQGCENGTIMKRNKIIPYNSKLKSYARYLRKHSTLSEVLLWEEIKNRTLGVQFHRQVPIDNFIVDFYCHELLLAIEIDGESHDNKYDYDQNRQHKLEDLGVRFVRFSDLEVKKDMFSVLRCLEKIIYELNEHPPSPPQGGNNEL